MRCKACSEVTAISPGPGWGCAYSFLPEATCSARLWPVYQGDKGCALPTCPTPAARACLSVHLRPAGKPARSRAARLPAHSICLIKALRLGLAAGPRRRGGEPDRKVQAVQLTRHAGWFSKEQSCLCVQPGFSEVHGSPSFTSVEGGGQDGLCPSNLELTVSWQTRVLVDRAGLASTLLCDNLRDRIALGTSKGRSRSSRVCVCVCEHACRHGVVIRPSAHTRRLRDGTKSPSPTYMHSVFYRF